MLPPDAHRNLCGPVFPGRHSVGKTSLAERYLHGEYNAKSTATIGAAFRYTRFDVSQRRHCRQMNVVARANSNRYAQSLSRVCVDFFACDR